MTLKEKILREANKTSCINCKHHEVLDTQNKPDYCAKSDKLILKMHVDCIRICDNFEENICNENCSFDINPCQKVKINFKQISDENELVTRIKVINVLEEKIK